MDLSEYFKQCLQGLHKTTDAKDYQQRKVQSRMNSMNNFRKDRRASIMYNKRNINDNMTPIKSPNASLNSKHSNESFSTTSSKTGKRLAMLAQWKAEKKMRMEQALNKVKPIFKVHHVPDPVGLPDLSKINSEIKGVPIKRSMSTWGSCTNLTQGYVPSSASKRILPFTSQSNHNVSSVNTNTTLLKSTRALVTNLVKGKAPSTANKNNVLPSTSQKKQNKSGDKNIDQSTHRKPNGGTRKKLNFRDMTKLTINNKSPLKRTRTSSLSSSNSYQTRSQIHRSGSIENLSSSRSGTNHHQPTKVGRSGLNRTKSESIESLSSRSKTNNHQPTKVGKSSLNRTKSESIESLSSTRSNTRKHKSTETVTNVVVKQTGDNKQTKPEVTKKLRGRPKKVIIKTPEKTPSKETISHRMSRQSTPYKPKPKDQSIECYGEEQPPKPVIPALEEDLIDFTTPDKNKKTQEEEHMPYISPFVTISRGKTNARNEYHMRSGADVNSPVFNLKDSSKHASPKAGAQYFRQMLDDEIKRLQEMCQRWQKYRENNIPTEAHDMIDVTIGQTNLLIAKKFQQFRGLINECQNGDYKEKPITCMDLHGFWDMIYMQVQDLDKRYKNLDTMKDNEWVEILPKQETSTMPNSTIPLKRPRGRPPTKKTQSTSALRALIQAAKKKKQENANCQDNNLNTFDGGYFRVLSPAKTLSSKNERKSLRLSVLSNAQKRISSPGFAMMKITQAIKSGDGITPSKSILKTEGSKSAKKSVLFKEDVSFEGKGINKTLTKSVLFQDDDDEISVENDINLTNVATTTLRKSRRLSKSNV